MLSGRVWLLSSNLHNLPLPPNVKLFLSRWPPTKHRKILQNLTCKIDHHVYCYSFKIMIQGGSRGSVREVCTPPHPPEMTCSFLIELVFSEKNNFVVYWCWNKTWGEVEEFMLNAIKMVVPLSGAPPPRKNPGSAPSLWYVTSNSHWESFQ